MIHLQLAALGTSVVFFSWSILTNTISNFKGFSLAEHSHAAVALLFIWTCPVFMRVLRHWCNVGREGLLCTLSLLQAQNIWILLPDPLWIEVNNQKYCLLPQSLNALDCKLTSRPFFLTQALSPSTFHDVIFILALRPSLLVILSGGSSYNIGASGSLVFLAFFGVAITKEKYLYSSGC